MLMDEPPPAAPSQESGPLHLMVEGIRLPCGAGDASIQTASSVAYGPVHRTFALDRNARDHPRFGPYDVEYYCPESNSHQSHGKFLT